MRAEAWVGLTPPPEDSSPHKVFDRTAAPLPLAEGFAGSRRPAHDVLLLGLVFPKFRVEAAALQSLPCTSAVLFYGDQLVLPALLFCSHHLLPFEGFARSGWIDEFAFAVLNNLRLFLPPPQRSHDISNYRSFSA